MHAADHFRLRGLHYAEAGADADAAACLAEAALLRPGDGAIWGDLGVCLHRLGRLGEAETVLRRSLRLAPARVESLIGLGIVLAARDAAAEAEAWLRAALRQRPDDATALTSLGLLLHAAGRFTEAKVTLRAALARRPGDADALHNLAVVLAAIGELAEADSCCAAALRRDAMHAEAQTTRGIVHLLAGRLDQGWAGFAWRWRRRGSEPPWRFDRPEWAGEALAGRTLLLHAEQGLGDAIQMLRFVPAVAARGRVVVQVPGPLLRWARALPDAPPVHAAGEAPPPFDVQCSLMDLPRHLGVTLANIPPPLAPRLPATPWSERVAALPGRRVGLAWAGNPLYAADRRRSLPPAELAVLADIPGISFVSLQKDAPVPPPLALHDWTESLHDLAETAALVATLDLVIAVDSAVAHLAATLGRPVWLLNRFDTCWRWLRERDDSPWYPGLRIFRQPAAGDWAGVLVQMQAALLAG